MNAEPGPDIDLWIDLWIDRTTRIACPPGSGAGAGSPRSGVRLLTWTAMFALCCLTLWVVSGMAAHAGDPGSSPGQAPGSVSGAGPKAAAKAAARAIGNAGSAAAGAIARDSSRTGTVPGYAGTDLPERNIGANALEDRGRARLADPDDPGGKAGRTVVEGTVRRPAASVPANDPAVARSEGHRRRSAIPGAPRGRPRLGQRLGLRGGTGGRRGRRRLRWRALLRRRRLRDRAAAGQQRFRRRDHAAQHGAGARRRGVRPREAALLHGQAQGLHDQAVRARQLLQEQRFPRGACRLQKVRATARASAP